MVQEFQYHGLFQGTIVLFSPKYNNVTIDTKEIKTINTINIKAMILGLFNYRSVK